MRQFASNESVRLVKELPELELSPGEVGIVRGKWETPFMAYDVEFRSGERAVRLLLLENHLKAA